MNIFLKWFSFVLMVSDHLGVGQLLQKAVPKHMYCVCDNSFEDSGVTLLGFLLSWY